MNNALISKFWRSLLLASAVALPVAVVRAGVNPPEAMTYQGFLVDGNGIALATNAPKNFDVIFRIYTAQTGGTLQWSEQQTTTVDKGYFSVVLGEGSQVGSESHGALSTVFSGTDATDRYVGITVKGIGAGNADVDILPRLRMMTSPFAFLARNAVNASSLANTNNAQVMTVSGGNIGINKALPSKALDVTGAGAFSGNLNANDVFVGDIGGNAAFAHTNSATTLGYALAQTANGFYTILNARNNSGSVIDFRFDNASVASLVPGGFMKLNGGLAIGSAGITANQGQFRTAGTSSGYYFKDRTQTPEWALYADSGAARLFNGTTDKFSVETGGKVNVYGNSAVEFGYGLSKGSADNGKIGYQTFDDALDIVGAGTGTTRKISLYGDVQVFGGGGISSAKFKVTDVLPMVGASWASRSGTFTSSGGTLVFTFSITGFSATANTSQFIDLLLDGVSIGSTGLNFNQASVHMSFPTRTIYVTGKPAGQHTVSFNGHNTAQDLNDFSQVTVMELPF